MRLLRAFLLLSALTIAFAATGFAHKTSPQKDANLAAYLASGGTMHDICGSDHAQTRDCEACRLIAGAALPNPTATSIAICTSGQLALSIPETSQIPAIFHITSIQARAPPSA